MQFAEYQRHLAALSNRRSDIRPYEQIPFQFSLHVIHKVGMKPEHRKFLAEERNDPRAEFMRRLKSAVKPSGSIVVFNAAFEKSRIKSVRWFCRSTKKAWQR